MKTFLLVASTLFYSLGANGQVSGDLELRWMNGPQRDSVYRISEAVNKVHVWEAWKWSCGYCQSNASQVKNMANEFADNERVQFIDVGLDRGDREYRMWIERHNPPFPVLNDGNREVWDVLTQTNGVPQTWVTDCNGQLVGYTIGEWNKRAVRTIRNAIGRALEVQCE